MNVFITELCHQSDTEIVKRKVLSYSFIKCITKKKNKEQKVRNGKIFVSLNPAVVYQIQLGLALAYSLLERITKVIQKC